MPDVNSLPLRGERLASLFLVADGVSGGDSGSDASRIAAETIARYVSSTLRSYHAAGTSDESKLLESLRVRGARGASGRARRGNLAARRTRDGNHPHPRDSAIWPWLYVVQLGDSRCYYFWNGGVHQVTRDQTIGQDLVDQGLLPRERLPASPFKDVLSSAAGADEALPEVSRVRVDREGSALFFCTDGVTKHVTDAEIAQAITEQPTSEDVCRALLGLALERGASDNITMVVARRRRTPPHS